jgi:hypothetical protein
MPEEEGEDEPDADAHDPGHQHKHQQPDVREGLQEKAIKIFPESRRIFQGDQSCRRVLWMSSSRVVRSSGCPCQSRYSPGFDPGIFRHSGI